MELATELVVRESTARPRASEAPLEDSTATGWVGSDRPASQPGQGLGIATDDQVITRRPAPVAGRVGLEVLGPVSNRQRMDATLGQRIDRLPVSDPPSRTSTSSIGERQLAVREGVVKEVRHSWAQGKLRDLAAGATVGRHDSVGSRLAQLGLRFLAVRAATMNSLG